MRPDRGSESGPTMNQEPQATPAFSGSLEGLMHIADRLDSLTELTEEDVRSSVKQDVVQLRSTVSLIRGHMSSESLIARLSARFLNLPLDDVEEGIIVALSELGQATLVQRAYVFLLSGDGTCLAEAFEWTLEGVGAHDFDAFRGVPVTAFPWSMEQFLN